MESGIYIEEALLEVLKETDLLNFERKLCVELQLMRLEHFDHVTDDELKSYTGLSQPAIRRLRLAIAEKKKKAKRLKGLFSTIGRKEGKDVSKVVLAPSTVSLTSPTNDKGTTCLIAKDQIKLMERLGEGSFAVVKRAIWTRAEGKKTDVAVKILRDATPEVIEDLQLEVNNMQKLQHPNLIRLYGIVFSNPAMMVVEFCDGGSLVDRLRCAQKPVVLVSVLVEYAQQVAKGMAYLESKHCVHRDLAARNVLLTDSERTVKICDFGLMRALEDNERLYVMSAQKKVPFAWCPPESLRLRQFSHASDVWAFGITLWEMFSYGEEPWAGCRGAEVLTKTEAGERLTRPQKCSNEIYDIMASCWLLKAEERPKFSLLKSLLADIKFMIAEARETCIPSNDMDLEVKPNDRIIVIEGSGSVWFGQNVRTRSFGRFPRSSVHAKSERNPTTPTTGAVTTANPTGVVRISKPVPGSFIHAGHGDINPGQSWGQPDRIDDIYLKNPILRNEIDLCNGHAPRPLGPQIISSVIDMHPTTSSSAAATNELRCCDEKQLPTKKPKPSLPSSGPSASSMSGFSRATPSTSGNVTARSSVDPFAPFGDYEYDTFDENTFNAAWQQPIPNRNGSSQQATSNVPTFYDQPPPSIAYQSTPSTSTACMASGTLGGSGGDQRAPLAVRPAPNITASSGALAGKTSIVTSHVEHPSTSRAAITPPAIPPPPNVHPRFGSQGDGTPTKSKIVQYSSLPRPMRSTPDLTIINGGTSGRPPAGSTPPPVRASNFLKQHSTSASTLTTPLGNITEPPASLFVSTAAVAEGAKNGSLDPSSKRHNTSAPTLTKAAPNSGNNFRASSYLAATAREVHAAKSRSAVIETDDQGTVPSPSVVQNASNGEAAVYRETVFGVKPKNMSAETLTPPITDSAQPGTKVIPASPISSVSKVEQIGSQNGALDRTPIGHSFGPDPFEVSSSVKRIANRNRYSQVFADKTRPTATTSSGVSQSATFAAPVGAALLRPPSAQTPRSDADVNASTSMFLPPPSSLLVGHTEASSAGTANVTSSAALENNSSIYARPGLVPNPVSPAPQQNSTQYASTSVTYNQGFVSGYMGSSKSAGTVQSCGLPNFIGQQPVPIHTFHPAQPRDLTHRDSTPILEGYSRTGFATAIPSTSAASQRGQPLASIATKSVDVVRMNRPTFLYDANLSNSARSGLPADLRTMGAIGAVGILQPKRLSSSTQSTSLANDEILGLFDPLSSTASASSTTNASAGAKPTLSNPVDMVLKNALFAGREKCAAMLRRCNNDVARAVRELKTDELLAMGIAKDRAQAVSALEDCRWDLNAAAAALLT